MSVYQDNVFEIFFILPERMKISMIIEQFFHFYVDPNLKLLALEKFHVSLTELEYKLIEQVLTFNSAELLRIFAFTRFHTAMSTSLTT